ncbi:hypothetical protein Xoosp14_91 [Xanthomonas phage Xoo-sp14]|nr:hypothetical protein Xoosp14_91 [Xanthomonas phage Xoo-sp14]
MRPDIEDDEDEDDEEGHVSLPMLRSMQRACTGFKEVGSDRPNPGSRRTHIENMLADFEDRHFSDAVFDSALSHAKYFGSDQYSSPKRRDVDSVTLERIGESDDVRLTAVFRTKR